jgi:hypothetical protein
MVSTDHDRRCTATSKRTGERCGAWAVPGANVCKWHGAKSPQAVAARQRRAEQTAAVQAVETYGLPRNIDPHDALLEEIARTAGHVDWLARIVAALDPAELVWGRHSTEKGFTGEGPVDKTTEQAGITVWLDLYQRERKHLVDVCKAAVGAGIAERQVRLAEQQGQLVARLLLAVIEDAELGLDAERQEVARRVAARHLRALPAG